MVFIFGGVGHLWKSFEIIYLKITYIILNNLIKIIKLPQIKKIYIYYRKYNWKNDFQLTEIFDK